MKQPDLYYFETMQMTPQVLSKFTENARILHTKFDWACDVIFMVSK